MLSMLDITIKDTDIEPIADRINNDIDVKVDAGVLIDETISKTDTELNMKVLIETNTIIEKKVYKSNLF